MKDVIYNLFGEYVPVSYLGPDGSEIIPSGLAGVDWQWLAGVILFGIVLYVGLTLLRGFIKR